MNSKHETTADNSAEQAEATSAPQKEDCADNAQPDLQTDSSVPAENAAQNADISRPAAETAPVPSENESGENGGAMTTVAPPQKKRRRWIWNLVFIAIIALGMWGLFGIAGEITQGDGMTFSEAMAAINAPGAVMLVGAVVGVMVVDCLKFCFVNKAVIGKMRPAVAMKTSFLGKFYDNVTPFATGGQPMQIYYLTTKGVGLSHSSAVVLIRYFGSIFAFTFLGALFMILGVCFGVLEGNESGTLILVAGWVGLAINLILPTFIAFFVFFPKLASRCTKWFINVGVKLHIVKDKEKVMAKALKTVDDFVTSFKIIIRKPLLLILFLLCCFAENLLTFSIPFFVMNAFSCNVDGMFISIISLNVFATFGVSFIPTPGNTGVVEGMGVLAFRHVAGAALAWAVLFWRIAVYYLYIIIGIVMTVVDLIIKNIKSARQG